jgi:hypothetical protein
MHQIAAVVAAVLVYLALGAIVLGAMAAAGTAKARTLLGRDEMVIITIAWPLVLCLFVGFAIADLALRR